MTNKPMASISIETIRTNRAVKTKLVYLVYYWIWLEYHCSRM